MVARRDRRARDGALARVLPQHRPRAVHAPRRGLAGDGRRGGRLAPARPAPGRGGRRGDRGHNRLVLLRPAARRPRPRRRRLTAAVALQPLPFPPLPLPLSLPLALPFPLPCGVSACAP